MSDPSLLNWFLERPVPAWIGHISYGLYLWHLLIFWQLVPRVQNYLIAGACSVPLPCRCWYCWSSRGPWHWRPCRIT